MIRIRSLLLAFLLLLGPAALLHAENWPGFRGPRGDGTSLETGLPLHWSTTENVAWKAAIPGRGHASPVVWGDRIFLVTALEERQERVLLCLDRRNGKLLWQRVALTVPLEHIHEKNSYASSTPLTDGERVYVTFLDRDEMFVAAYDFQGKQLWAVRPGKFTSVHGYSSNPILYKNTIIVNGDHDGDGYLVALDRRTGATVWKTPRPNNTRSYCTPLIRAVNGVPHMMMTGSKCTASYNPENGKLQWIIDGPTEQFVAAPVYNGKYLFITAGFPERHVLAIRPDGTGNVTNTNIVWRTRRDASYVPSPLLIDDHLLVVNEGGFLTCFVPDTGEILWTERLGGGCWASPVTASGLAYIVSEQGVTYVVKPGKTCERLAANEIGEPVMASPVISQGQIFLRGLNHLFALGAGK